MIRKRSEYGIIAIAAAFFIMFLAISMRYFVIAFEKPYISTAKERAVLTLTAGESQGTIYDRNMMPLVNQEKKYIAAVIPTYADKEMLKTHAVDQKEFDKSFEKGEPFVFECDNNTPESESVTLFEIPVRYGSDQTAQHIIGYLSDGHGVSGIEYAYDSILRGDDGESCVMYQTDGFCRVLIGDGKETVRSTADKKGVVTTLDSNIQKICETEGNGIEKGAVIVADIYSGDILGMASFPEYCTDDIEKAMSDERCPMINRGLYSYGVGSIFKLVTACEAINENKSDYRYKCTGNISVEGQIFNCHRLDGHDMQNMTEAMKNSCNTYFISLSKKLDTKAFHDLAYSLGFGKESWLCNGIVGSTGILPSYTDLSIPAELANFSFGQGKLTATPIQITQLTCTIANGGYLPQLRIIKGLTSDGKTIANEKIPQTAKIITSDTAEQLQEMMISAIRDNEESNARTLNVPIAAKTSTAQTGRFDDEGNELCHAWITGFFPAYEPKYALTVLIEDGGYGNTAAAPIFRNIAEKITSLE